MLCDRSCYIISRSLRKTIRVPMVIENLKISRNFKLWFQSIFTQPEMLCTVSRLCILQYNICWLRLNFAGFYFFYVLFECLIKNSGKYYCSTFFNQVNFSSSSFGSKAFSRYILYGMRNSIKLPLRGNLLCKECTGANVFNHERAKCRN